MSHIHSALFGDMYHSALFGVGHHVPVHQRGANQWCTCLGATPHGSHVLQRMLVTHRVEVYAPSLLVLEQDMAKGQDTIYFGFSKQVASASPSGEEWGKFFQMMNSLGK